MHLRVPRVDISILHIAVCITALAMPFATASDTNTLGRIKSKASLLCTQLDLVSSLSGKMRSQLPFKEISLFVKHTRKFRHSAKVVLSEEEKDAVGFNGALLNPADLIRRVWKAMIVPSLRNDGNTCFFVALLQCLLHSTAFVNAIMQDPHRRASKVPCFCVLCELKRLVYYIYGSTGKGPIVDGSMSVLWLSENIPKICRRFEKGKQEDAHEALISLLGLIMRASIYGCGSGSDLSEEPKFTRLEDEYQTSIHGVFGGCLQSTITCCTCGKLSKTFQAFLDMSVDITKSNRIDDALSEFFTAEKLEGDAKYNCERCGAMRNATKETSLRRAPLELVVQLKRFRGAEKNSKSVRLREKIDLFRYVNTRNMTRGGSKKLKKSLRYSLRTVLVHRGPLATSGHCYAYVKEGNKWLRKDDEISTRVSLDTVLSDEAYMLFYERDLPKSWKRSSRVPITVVEMASEEEEHRRGHVSSTKENGCFKRILGWVNRTRSSVRHWKEQKGGKGKEVNGTTTETLDYPHRLSQETPVHRWRTKLKRKRASSLSCNIDRAVKRLRLS